MLKFDVLRRSNNVTNFDSYELEKISTTLRYLLPESVGIKLCYKDRFT